jgi:2-C-methyl-D-erythritol 4-phosphate cytidylyltransferase/2-C-methyl-D-erythritol 2,4-cyclodiphosphate synthase
LKQGRDGRIAGTVPRDGLWRAQTPQGFRFAEILAAHRAAAGAELTDDAAVAEHAGLAVTLVQGGADNLKITSAQDLERAERWLAARLDETRVGHGFDVHRFGPGDHVMLCGVRVAHDAGLIGHSDADVGLHALTDAILGALGAGDIGSHFPPTDARWRGAESALFLRHADELVRQRGGRIAHVDVTLICERPKVAPHRAAMVARLAEVLDLAMERVSVKATTTEGLGFTGRGEGIAAQATATLRLPAPQSDRCAADR